MLNTSEKHFLWKYLLKNGNPAIFVDVLIGFHCSLDQLGIHICIWFLEEKSNLRYFPWRLQWYLKNKFSVKNLIIQSRQFPKDKRVTTSADAVE